MTENFDSLNDWGRSSKTAIYILWLFLYCINLLTIVFSHPPEISWLELFILNLVSGFLFLFVAVSLSAYIRIYLEPETREWHACEHKSIQLIKAESTLSISNLKASPALSKSCGSVLMGLQAEIYLFFIFALSASYLKKFWLLEFMAYGFITWSILVYLITAVWLVRLKVLSRFITGDMIPYLILMPLMIVPLILEKYVALREPPEEKLRKTAAELQRFIKENKLYPLQS